MKMRKAVAGVIRRFVAFLTDLSYVELGVIYGCFIIGFGVLYFGLFMLSRANAPNLGGGTMLIHLLNGVYFSIITAASVGYGDISPHGLSKIVASFESLSSLFVFAILVSKPISERQEKALYQMHKLTLDEIFTSIREGFFIMRKDFDGLMEEVRTTGALSEHAKENFETALHHGEVLLQDIPAFYDNERQLYKIDIRREKLLAEAVERTVERLVRTLGLLEAGHITLTVRTHNILKELAQVGGTTMKQWKHHSSKDIHAMLQGSMVLFGEIEEKHL